MMWKLKRPDEPRPKTHDFLRLISHAFNTEYFKLVRHLCEELRRKRLGLWQNIFFPSQKYFKHWKKHRPKCIISEGYYFEMDETDDE